MKNVKELSVGSYVMRRNEPAKVVKKERVTVGTHMHSKIKLTVQGMFSGSSETMALSPHENLEDVEIIRKKGQVIAKLPPSQVQLMDLDSYETHNAEVGEELFSQLSEGNVITFVDYNGKVTIMASGA